MPASLEHIRGSMHVKPTAQNKGLQLTLTITAYDNGMVNVGDTPQGSPALASDHDPVSSWLSTVETVSMMLVEFRNQVRTRQAS